jgi:hypothetical protein
MRRSASVLPTQRQQNRRAHVEAVGQREADQQHADQHPPDQFEGLRNP